MGRDKNGHMDIEVKGRVPSKELGERLGIDDMDGRS